MPLLKVIEANLLLKFSKVFHKIILGPFNRYWVRLMSFEQWDKATRYGERLVKRFPKRIDYAHRLATCYKSLGNTELATNTLKKALDLNLNIKAIVGEMEKGFQSISFLESKYVFLGGEQNLGCIEHTIIVNGEEENYLTKISTKWGLEKEKQFFRKIYNKFPVMRTLTPKLINIKEIKGMDASFITMERINGTEPLLNRENLEKVIHANNLISSIKLAELRECCIETNLDRNFELICKNVKNHPICALHSFQSIHKESTNKQLFHLVYERMKKGKYSSASFKIISRLEKAILGYHLFNHLNLDIHYSLQHGDFNTHNMLMHEATGKLYIIDWGNMMIGPTWVDLAGFFGQSKMPFHVIYEDYLESSEASNNLEPIEEIFFIYTLIITWFIVFNQKEFEELQDLYMLPAIELLESIVMEKFGDHTYIDYGISS